MLLPALFLPCMWLMELQGTRPFMSGEILGRERYFKLARRKDDDDDDGDADAQTIRVVAPAHSFWHDLESLFWILFWLCMCRAGPTMQRPEIWLKFQERETEAGAEYKQLFGDAANHQLAKNKTVIIKFEDHFELAMEHIHGWCWQLRPLLRQFSVILRNGYRSHRFSVNETYDAFTAALQEAEKRLLAKPKTLQPEQQAAYDVEENRRAADSKDWKLPSRTLPKLAQLFNIDEEPPAPEPPVEKLAALVLIPNSERDGSPDSADGDAGQTAKAPPVSKIQTGKAPARKAAASKAVSKRVQAATAVPAARSTGMRTRAMGRAALPAPSSSTVQTQPQRVAAPPEKTKKKAAPRRAAKRAQEEEDEA